MYVVAHVRLKVALAEESRFKSAASEVMRHTHQESGCVVFQIAQDIDDPSLFYVTELWTSQEAMELHFVQDHAQRAREVIMSIAKIIDAKVMRGDLQSFDAPQPESTAKEL
jgi:quinol monooxygenase YgiN